MKPLEAWWAQVAVQEAAAVIPKAREYGSRELVAMGRELAAVQGREDWESVPEAEAAETAIWFYALGKMQRWTAAMARGEKVSDDTLHDLGVYVRMVQRLRDCGQWPGPVQARDDDDDKGERPGPLYIYYSEGGANGTAGDCA